MNRCSYTFFWFKQFRIFCKNQNKSKEKTTLLKRTIILKLDIVEKFNLRRLLSASMNKIFFFILFIITYYINSTNYLPLSTLLWVLLTILSCKFYFFDSCFNLNSFCVLSNFKQIGRISWFVFFVTNGIEMIMFIVGFYYNNSL